MLIYIYIYIYIEREREREREIDFLQKFAFEIMEAKESHNLLSASWRTRKAGGVV